MAGDEHQAQQIVIDPAAIALGIDSFERELEFCIVHGRRRRVLALELEIFLVASLVTPKTIDSATLGGGHQPCCRILRYARLRPLLECRDECVLRQFLGKPDVTNKPRETGDQLGRFDPANGFDRATCSLRIRHVNDPVLVVGSELLAPAHPTLFRFGCQRRLEIFQLEDLADFDFVAVVERRALHVGHHLILRLGR
jgi:hypothetical protein